MKVVIDSYRHIKHVLLYYRYMLRMRPQGKVFDGSSSLFETTKIEEHYRQRHSVDPIHTCKSRPSDLSQAIT